MYVRKYILLLSILALLSACAQKELLVDPLKPDPYIKPSQSATRLLNFAYDMDLTFNGTMVTANLIASTGASYVLLGRPAIPYFPSDGVWHRSQGTLGPVPSGNPFGIPDEFIGPDGNVDVKVNFTKTKRGTNPSFGKDSIEFTEIVDPNRPKDIFFYLDDPTHTRSPFRSGWNYDNVAIGNPFDIVKAEVPKDLSKPSDPRHFKIRVINLASLSDIGAKFSNGDLYNNLTGTGAVTLTFADGSQIDPKLTNISSVGAEGTYVSDYAELDYGTYMFRVQDASSTEGVFLPQKIYHPAINISSESGIMTVNTNTYPYGEFSVYSNPTSITIVLDGVSVLANLADAYKYKGVSNEMPTARTQFFEPGGIYTVVVSAKLFGGRTIAGSVPQQYYTNSYEIIQDNVSAKNYSYGEIQIINVMPGAMDVTAKIGEMDYTETNDYSDDPANPKNFNSLRTKAKFRPFQVGNYPVSISARGSVLAEGVINLEPSEALTIWICPDSAGNPRILSRNVDLSYTKLIRPELNPLTTRADNIMGYYATDLYMLNLSQDVPALQLAFVSGNSADEATPRNFIGTFYQGVVTGKRSLSPSGLLSNSFTPDVRVYDIAGNALTELKPARFKFNEYLAVNYNAVKYMPKISALLYTPAQPDYDHQPIGYTEHGVFSLVIIGNKANGTLKSIVVNHIK